MDGVQCPPLAPCTDTLSRCSGTEAAHCARSDVSISQSLQRHMQIEPSSEPLNMCCFLWNASAVIVPDSDENISASVRCRRARAPVCSYRVPRSISVSRLNTLGAPIDQSRRSFKFVPDLFVRRSTHKVFATAGEHLNPPSDYCRSAIHVGEP